MVPSLFSALQREIKIDYSHRLPFLKDFETQRFFRQAKLVCFAERVHFVSQKSMLCASVQTRLPFPNLRPCLQICADTQQARTSLLGVLLGLCIVMAQACCVFQAKKIFVVTAF